MPSKIELINLLKNRNLQEVANIIGVSKRTISRLISKYNLSHREIQFSDYPQKLTDIQIEIINGNMLGDGFIRDKGYFSFGQQQSKEEYVKYLNQIFMPFSRPIYFAKSKKPKLVSDKVHDETILYYYSCRFQTISCDIFKTIRDKWYKNSIKIVPNDLVLTPLTLAIWFADDGHNNTKKRSLSLATHSFQKKEVEMLINTIGNTFKIKSTMNVIKNKPIISISCRNYFDFIDIIKPHLMYIKCLDCKINTNKVVVPKAGWGANKLNKCQKEEIVNSYNTKTITQRELAEKYKVSCSAISKIINKQIWL